MSDIKIHCKVLDCYWNVGVNDKDNCARGEVDISAAFICQAHITKKEAARRLGLKHLVFDQTEIQKESG